MGKNLCPRSSNDGKKVSEACPVTCGECSNKCEDDSSFLYNNKRSCEWIAEVQGRINKLCDKTSNDGKLVSEYCPSTCNACSRDNNNNDNDSDDSDDEDDEDDNTCEDDSSFLYNNKRSCQWIGER